MATLPVGMQLVSALDDSELQALSTVGDTSSYNVHEHVTLLPLESDNAALDVEMDIDLDVFCPSAMLDTDTFGDESSEIYFDAIFQSDWGNHMEQMLLGGSEETAVHSDHQHGTTPGKDCQCRNFAIRANRVQAQQERIVETIAAKDQKRVLRHTFGSGKKLLGFGFGEGPMMDQSQQQDVGMMDERSMSALGVDGAALKMKQEMLAAEYAVAVGDMKLMSAEAFVAIKQEMPSMTEHDQMFSSPLHRSQPESSVLSPLSTTSFVSLENMIATPLSTTSRSTVHPGMPMMRSLSPADEFEKMAASGSKTLMPTMNILRENFEVSPGRDTMPLVKPSAVLPPPYFRGALDSPEKRRVHSKTFNSCVQSLSFSFSDESLTDR